MSQPFRLGGRHADLDCSQRLVISRRSCEFNELSGAQADIESCLAVEVFRRLLTRTVTQLVYAVGPALVALVRSSSESDDVGRGGLPKDEPPDLATTGDRPSAAVYWRWSLSGSSNGSIFRSPDE
jgi:hypothetical protein